MDLITLASAHLSCRINPFGAELHDLTSADGREWLWDGDPAVWAGRAPILFPVVGMLAGKKYRWEGREYALDKHGFARRRALAVIEAASDRATLRLRADEATRAVYPFAFELDLDFALDTALTVTATVCNRGEGAMPFSFGFHPALRSPRGGDARLHFEAREDGPVWRIDGKGLLARAEPLPGDGTTLAIDDALFANDAMILRSVASQGLRFDRGDASVRISWSNLPDLGLWTRPGAGFLCIEPWAGYNDPAGFAGDISEKPGILLLDPGARWIASMTIAPL